MVWKVKKAGQRFNECRLFGVEDLQRPLNSTTTTTSGCCFGAVALLACGSILLTAPYFGQFSWRCRAVSVLCCLLERSTVVRTVVRTVAHRQTNNVSMVATLYVVLLWLAAMLFAFSKIKQHDACLCHDKGSLMSCNAEDLLKRFF